VTVRTIHPPFTPYKPGEPVRVLLETLTVERCVRLASTEADPRWQVTARRGDGKLVDRTVGRDGTDRHGYVSKPVPA
jgi:hypothetical protein